MRCAAILSLAFCLPSPAPADEPDARTVAQDLLKKGSALFDAQDAMALSATYTDEARVEWIEKDKDTGKYKTSSKEGRTEIDSLYRDLFKDPSRKRTSRNTVEFAKFVAPDVLLIQGYFEPDVNEGGKYSFVQERVKEGDKWLIRNLRLYILFNN